MNSAEINVEEKALVVFGIVADVQYGEADDQFVYGRTRYYRSSYGMFKRALDDWCALEKSTNVNLKFLLQLGDLIDGNVNATTHERTTTLQMLLDLIDESPCVRQCLHIWGNHEVYAFDRQFLAKSTLHTARLLNQTKSDADTTNYYYIDVTPRLRLVCLDVYEISPYGYDANHEIVIKAESVIDKAKLLTDEYSKRFKAYNGAASEQQLVWLEDQLKLCKKTNKKVLLCGHTPLLIDVSHSTGIVWNANEILELIWSYENVVIAYLAGHYHAGGYFVDEHQIHHLTLNAILETPPESNNAYATAYVYEDKFVLKNQIDDRSFTVHF